MSVNFFVLGLPLLNVADKRTNILTDGAEPFFAHYSSTKSFIESGNEIFIVAVVIPP